MPATNPDAYKTTTAKTKRKKAKPGTLKNSQMVASKAPAFDLAKRIKARKKELNA